MSQPKIRPGFLMALHVIIVAAMIVIAIAGVVIVIVS